MLITVTDLRGQPQLEPAGVSVEAVRAVNQEASTGDNGASARVTHKVTPRESAIDEVAVEEKMEDKSKPSMGMF